MEEGNDGGGMNGEMELREQDKWLPIANVYRIMKNALPEKAKVSKEAKECVQECVSEFVSFITSEASEKCSAEKRKTVNGEDILFAMTSLGFENYAEVLKIYLTKYREYLTTRERSKRPGGSTLSASASAGSGMVSQSGADPMTGPTDASPLDEATGPPTEASEDDESFHYGAFDQTADEPLYPEEYSQQFSFPS